MALLSGRRLSCFYCNRRSAQRHVTGLRKWKCENCEAVNHIDSRGDITDPPTEEATVSTRNRYVHHIERPASAPLPPLEHPIFCKRCINNQHLVTQSLANYLPLRSDPRYDEFEANFPIYRKSLEERYPQVCAECEPRVRDRIQQSGYFAKTDHLRRMRENTQNTMLHMKQNWRRTSLLTLVGSLVWFSSTLVLLLWHGFGALAQEEDGLRNDSITLKYCMLDGFTSRKVDLGCSKEMYSPAGWVIVMSLLTLYWNPVMRRRWIDRAVGLKEFYKLQLTTAFARSVVWYVLGKAKDMELEDNAVKACHITMLAFNVIVPIISYRTVYIAKSPRVTFQDSCEPLTAPKEVDTRYAHAPTRPTPPTSQASSSPSHKFSRFGRQEQAPRQTERPAYRPLTPPPEDDGDEMDLDIPEKNYDLQPTTHRRMEPQWAYSSPFHGKLPAAPVSMERQLRNPPNKPSFQKTSPETQQSFFQRMTQRRTSNSGAQVSEPQESFAETQMQAPRFFADQDQIAQETGLESWFSDFFSLGEPAIGMRQKVMKSDELTPEASYPSNLWHQLWPILSLGLAVYGWSMAANYTSISLPLYFTALGIAAVVSGTRLRSTLSSNTVNHSDVLLCLLELFGALAIGYQIRQALLAGYRINEELGSFPLWYFGFMIFQESSGFVSAYRQSPRTQTAVPPQEYHRTRQQPPPREEEVSPPREPRPMLVESSFMQYSTPSLSSSALSLPRQRQMPAQPSFQPVANSFEERVARAQETRQSPGSKAFQGLSLGLDDGAPMQRQSARLRGKVVNPWEVGGM